MRDIELWVRVAEVSARSLSEGFEEGSVCVKLILL